MLQPLADALADALSPGAGDRQTPPLRVWFALQGEMSATVMRFPELYTQLVRGGLRSRDGG